MKLIDLTGTIEPGMWHYPHIPPVEVEMVTSIAEHGSEAHRFTLATISGTYLETAAHLYPGRPTIDQVSPERFIREAVVLHMPKSAAEAITPQDLERAARDLTIKPGDAILMHTGWDRMWNAPNFVEDSPYLTMEAMHWIVAHSPSILGGDVPCFDNPRDGVGVNRVLFRDETLILAPLVNLEAVTQPRVRLMVFPLKIKGVCGTPCRALVEVG